MSAPDKKAPGGNPEALHSTNQLGHDRISPQGFKALHHLLHATKHLHAMTDLPTDGQQAAEILLTRIRADLVRLGGAK